MTASAPFPGDPSYDEVVRPSRGHFVEIEGHVRGMVPAFYVPHEKPEELVVKVDGAPLLSMGKTFTVAQVPIERRYAIKPNGDLYDQVDFHGRWIDWYHGYYKELVRQNPDMGSVDPGKPERQCIPDVRRFVSVMVDQSNPRRFVPMNYEPFATAGARAEKFYRSDGEAVEGDRMAVLCAAYADPAQRSRMRDDEVAEVEAHIGTSVRVSTSELEVKLETLNDLHAKGLLSDTEHSRQVGLLTGKPVEPEVAVTQELTTAKAAARCGKEFEKPTQHRANAAVRFHQRKCKACAEAGND